jgi:hypothetical protein
MTPTLVWALLAVIAIAIAIVFGIGRVIAADKARAEALPAPAEALPAPAEALPARDDASAPNEHVRNVALSCRISGHAYVAYDTGWRCATCGNHVPRREGELYGPAQDGVHERRRHAR